MAYNRVFLMYVNGDMQKVRSMRRRISIPRTELRSGLVHSINTTYVREQYRSLLSFPNLKATANGNKNFVDLVPNWFPHRQTPRRHLSAAVSTYGMIHTAKPRTRHLPKFSVIDPISRKIDETADDVQ